MIKDKKLIYLATPYSSDDKKVLLKRVKNVTLAAGKIMRDYNHYVFSPITHSHPIAEVGNLNVNRQYWEDYDLHMLTMCDEMWVIDVPGWRDSRGVLSEIRFSHRNKKPVYLFSESEGSIRPIKSDVEENKMANTKLSYYSYG